MKKLYFLFALLAATFSVQAQDSLNANLIGHLSYNSDLSDVWAYVDSSGGEWALVGVFNGVSIVDLSDPANPTEEFFLPGAGSTWRDLKTWGHYAYVSNESADGIRIIDLSDLPNSAPYKDTIIGGIATIHNFWIDEFGYLYSCGDGVNFGMTIFDLNVDPWNPTIAGVYDLDYVHDVYVRNNIAYAGEIYSGELTILDVSDKSNITILGSKAYANGFTHNTWLDSSGTVCFTTDELDYAYIYAWDVSDPANITQLDRIRSSLSAGAATPHNAHYFNGFLVTSYYADGIHIVDAHRPQNLVEVGYYDPSVNSGNGTYGMWGAYPFLPSGVVLATEMAQGLYVLDLKYKRAAYLEGNATDANSTNPLSNVNIQVVGTSLTEMTANNGNFATGTPDSGMFLVTATKYGYQVADTTLLLAPGQVAVWNPALVPAAAVGITVNVEESGSGNPIANAEVFATSLGTNFSFVTDANGQYTDSGFLEGNYDIIAGQWGFVTDGITTSIDAQNNVITIELDPGYYDDFVFDFGWTNGGTASQGFWERGEPVGTYTFGNVINMEDDAPDDWGQDCYVTGNGGGTIFDDDIDNGEVILSSPVMDLSSYNNPWIIFDWAFISTTNYGGNSFRDSIKIAFDNGNSHKVVWAQRDLLNNFWTRDTLRITDYLMHTSTFQFHILASDNQFDNATEAAFDMFRVEDQTTVGAILPGPDAAELNAFPNPSGGEFSLSYNLGSAKTGTVRLIDLEGREIRKYSLSDQKGTVRFSEDLPQGMYIGVLESDGQRLKTVKVLRY